MVDLAVPNDLPVCGIEEGHVKAIEAKGVRCQTSGVSFRLRKNFLGTQAKLLRLHDTEDLAARAEGIVGRATFRWKLLNRTILICAEGAVLFERNSAPARCPELGVDDLFSRQVFGFTPRRLGDSKRAFIFWQSHQISEPISALAYRRSVE